MILEIFSCHRQPSAIIVYCTQFRSGGHSGLVAKRWLRYRSVPGLKPYFTEDQSCMGSVAVKSYVVLPLVPPVPNVLPLVWRGSLERGTSSCVVLVI
ncbi:hypothetical protein AVEN_63825-1 [Araneus ventricosus]|uniref:Uncharacterized protein n=1 Tax=Araneus ventricosus TaxID=182803 RepID=A0A4Y2FV86_ARAVE|nr:hypothetical protein AVEN_63825-1 [Araneus ventricosus]